MSEANRLERIVSPILVGCDRSQAVSGVAAAIVAQWANTDMEIQGNQQ